MENLKPANLIPECQEESSPGEFCSPNSKITAVTTIMRITGVVFIIGASLLFMQDRWSYWSHLTKYGTFLSFALLVGCSGLVCGLRLHDPKGARTLLSLSTALLPVLFAQLGALIFSCFPEANQYRYDELYRWVSPGFSQTIGMAGISLLLLIPMTALGFSTLVKKAQTETTLLYTLFSLILLIPSRSDSFVLATTLIALCAYGWYERYAVANKTGLRTFEGTIIRLILWWPMFIFAGRNIMIYHITHDSPVPSMNFACVGLAILTLGLRLELPRWIHLCIDFTGWALCSVAVGLFIHLPYVPTQLLFGSKSLAGVGIGILVLTCYLHPLFKSGTNALQAIGWMTASLLCLHDVILLDTITSDIACMLLGLCRVRNNQNNNIPYQGLGTALAATGFLGFCYDLILHLHIGSWLIYAFVGLGTIIASSFIERANRKHLANLSESVANQHL